MPKMLSDIPTSFEIERLIIRGYEPGDGAWYYAVAMSTSGLKNHSMYPSPAPKAV